MKENTRNEAILTEAIRSFIESFPYSDDLLGICIFGSSVEKDLDRPPKDIDILTAYNGDKHFVGNKIYNNKKFEIFMRRFPYLCNNMRVLHN